MSHLWSRRCQGLTPYVAGEQPQGRTFIKLNTNENPYPPSPRVIEAIVREAGAGLRLYPDPACSSLRAAIGERFGLRSDQVFVGNGSDEVLALAFRAFFDEDRPIRVPALSYSFYPVFCDLYDLRYETVPLAPDFSIPPAPFLEASGGVVLANPNAPTGRDMEFADLTAIIAADPDRVVIVDEAYVDFGARSTVELIDQYPNLLVVRTFSKSGALAGLRVGYALGSAHLIEGLCRVRDSFNSYPVDRLAQAGAEAAIREREYYREITDKIIATRTWTVRRLEELGAEVCPSRANFLFVRFPGVSGKTLLDALREKGILVRWWNRPEIQDYLRISVGTDRDMEDLCQALEEITGAAGRE